MKKSLILLLTISIFFSSILIPINKADAVLVPITRIVAGSTGEKLLIGMAERAGVKLGTRQAQIDLVNGVNKAAVHGGDTRAASLIKSVNSAKPVREKGNIEKYVFDPLMFITGADVLVDIGKSLFGGTKDKPVDVFDEKGSEYVNVPNLSCLPYGKFKYGHTDPAVDGKIALNFSLAYKGNLLDTYPIWPFGFEGSATCTIDSTKRTTNGKVDITWTRKNVYFDVYPKNFKSSHTETFIFDSNDTFQDYGLKPQGDVNISSNSTITTNNYIDNRIDDRDVTNMPKYVEVNVDKTWIDTDTGITGKPYIVKEYPNIIIEDKDDGQTDRDKGWNIIVNVDVDYPDRIEDDVPDGEVTIPKDDDLEDGRDYYGDLTPVDDPIAVPKNFFMVMQDMGRKVSDMYSGVVHFFEVSVDGMKSLTTGMTGFVLFLDEFFDWLPSEYTALLGVGFTLGVVSFFLRR